MYVINEYRLIDSSYEGTFNYTFPSHGEYYVYYSGLYYGSWYQLVISYVYLSDCPAWGYIDTISVNKYTGEVSFKIIQSNSDEIEIDFGDGNTQYIYSPTQNEMHINYKYPTDLPYNTFNPYANFYNTTNNCYSYETGPYLEINSTNCGVSVFYYSSNEPRKGYFNIYSYKVDEDLINVSLKSLDGTKTYISNQNMINGDGEFYFDSDTFTFDKAGWNTFVVTSKGSYCSSVDTVDIYIYGAECNLSDVALSIQKPDENYEFHVQNAGAGYTYNWELYSWYGNIDTVITNTDSILKIKLPDNDFVSVYVYLYNETEDCGTYLYDYVTTGEMNCYSYFTYSYGESFGYVDFYNYSNEVKVYKWDFGDGTTSTDYTPSTHYYANSGVYCISPPKNQTKV